MISKQDQNEFAMQMMGVTEDHNTDGSPLNDFRFIYKSPSDTWPSHLECIHCGNRVERGIVNVSDHWLKCLERKEGIIEVGDKKEE